MPRKLNIFSMYEETLRIAIIMQKVYKISTTKRLAMLMHIEIPPVYYIPTIQLDDFNRRRRS